MEIGTISTKLSRMHVTVSPPIVVQLPHIELVLTSHSR